MEVDGEMMRHVKIIFSFFFIMMPFFAAEAQNKSKQVKTQSTMRSRPRSGESERTEGYIIKKTDKGLIKIPRKQSFKFGGSDVEGQAQSPSQTVFGKRPSPQRASLIPERSSFRKELLDTVGTP